MRTITIKDVARMAGVSKGTVSRVLNSIEGVSAPTRERILKLIANLDYHPNSSAKGLALRRTNNIGVIIPDTGKKVMSGFYWPTLLASITEIASSRGMNVLISTSRSEEDVDSAYQKVLKGRSVDGIIIGAEHFTEQHLLELRRRKFPFVIIGNSSCTSCHSVDIDHRTGARQVTEYLMALGHRDIALVVGPEQSPGVGDRILGFKDAMTAIGGGDMIYHCPLDMEMGAQKICSILLERPHLTALFVAAGDFVIGALKAAAELHLRIPDDLSLASFDDYPFYEYLSPSITAVSQPMQEIATNVSDKLFKLIAGQRPPEDCPVLPTRLVIRSSCSGPSKKA